MFMNFIIIFLLQMNLSQSQSEFSFLFSPVYL